MATRKIRIRGYNHAVNSATTVTFDGVEVFSGAMSAEVIEESDVWSTDTCLLYTSPSPRDRQKSRMPSSA